MSCKSAIYTANQTAQTVAVGGTLALGTVVRRFGCNANLSGSGILLEGDGYYDIDVSVTATPTAAGTVTITILKDGVAIQGATASATVAAAATAVNLSTSALVRLQCCNTSSITVVLTGAASTVSNVAVVVEKI